MTKESLLKARDIIIDAVNNAEIDNIDKIELMQNLWLLLSPEEYENGIKALQKDINNRRR